MRPWLFYKVSEDGKRIEFRRVQDRQVSNCLPPILAAGIDIPAGIKPEECIRSAVSKSRWVGQPVQAAESDVGKAILQGRW
jgi:hypothetical protein